MTEQTVISDVFTQYYLKSAVGCKLNGNVTDCQTLANLCVL
jgi:Meckelin (Transmembrane protein 67)